MTEGIFDRYSDRYDAWYDKNRFAYLSEVNALKRVIPKEGRGLEVGVGTGRFAAALGIDAGIDPSCKMLALAKKRGVDVQVGVGEDLPFKDGEFDYLLMVITLSFVQSPKKVIRECKRVLRKAGRIIIGIVDKDSFLGKYYKTKKDSIFYKEANLFNVAGVVGLLEDAGFTKPSFCQTLFRLLNEIDSIEEVKEGFGEGGFVVISAEKY